jgi:hypothetical protein
MQGFHAALNINNFAPKMYATRVAEGKIIRKNSEN